MHLAVFNYEPKRRLVLSTPRLQRNAGVALLLLATGMTLFVPFAVGVTWLVSRYTAVIDQQENLIIVAGAALTIPYALATTLTALLGLWMYRRRRTVEIDATMNTVIQRERLLRGEREQRFSLHELEKATCMARLKSAREGRRGGGAITSYAVNLVFRDGSIVNFESLDSGLPAMIEQVVPSVKGA